MINLHSEDEFNMFCICENLKKLRKLHNLSTTDVAKLINKSRQGYINYENGTREISINSLIILSGYYNVSIDEIVGNPYTLKNGKSLSFRTYELVNGELVHKWPISINTINEDVIYVKYDDNNIDFFWRTQEYQKNQLMLFEYYNKPYVSKVYYNQDGSGFFFLNNDHIEFTKQQAQNIIFIGVHSSSLKKNFHIDNFF